MSSALLVIDIQEGLFRPLPGPAFADQVIARINTLASRARLNDTAVIFVQHENAADKLEYGSANWTLVKALDIQAGDHTVRKTTPDAFLGTNLNALLTTLNVSHLVICGYATEFCVDTTVRRVAALGYDVTLVSDAHTTHDKPHAKAAQIRLHHNATLPAITSFGPRITASATNEIDFFT